MGRAENQQSIAIEGGELRLIDLLRIVARGRLLIFLCSAIGLTTAVVITLTMDNVYRGEVVLAPSAEEGPSGPPGGAVADVAMLAGIRIPGKAGVSKSDEAIAVLRSRRFTEQFIRRERLLPLLLPEMDKQPGLAQRIMDTATSLIGNDARDFTRESEELAEVEGKRRMIWDAYKVFRDIRKVEVDKDIGLVTLTVDWTDPVLAAEWANKLVTYINRESRTHAIEVAQKNIDYLQDQVEVTVETDRRRLLFNLIEGETRRIMLANSREEFAFRIIDPAIVPQEKVAPKRAMIASGGLVGGFVLGLLIVILRHALRDGEGRPV